MSGNKRAARRRAERQAPLPGGLIDLGQQAAARRDKQSCVVCKVQFSEAHLPEIAVVMALVDIPPLFSWMLPLGKSMAVTLALCHGCAHLVKEPEKLKPILLSGAPGTFGAFEISWVRPQDRTFHPLEDPIKVVAYTVHPPTFFEGRAAGMRACYNRHKELQKGCLEVEKHLDLRVVGGFSSDEDIRIVYNFGLMFWQEGFSDGPPIWFCDPRLLGNRRHAYLVKNGDGANYIGVVAFDLQGYNTLSWVWLHPLARRQGTLSGLWPHFERFHPSFKILTPVSLGMQRFLAGHPGHELVELTGPAKVVA
jgi:hypothetical protein